MNKFSLVYSSFRNCFIIPENSVPLLSAYSKYHSWFWHQTAYIYILSEIIQLLTSISVDIRIYQPEKVIFTEAGSIPLLSAYSKYHSWFWHQTADLYFIWDYTIIDFNFGWHKDLSTRKSDIHWGRINSTSFCLQQIPFLILTQNCRFIFYLRLYNYWLQFRLT